VPLGGISSGEEQVKKGMEMAQKKFWGEIEGKSWDEVVAVQERKLQKQVNYLLESSKFYQRKLGEAGISFDDIKTITDLRRVPFTEKTELRDSLKEEPPLGLHVAAPLNQIIQIQASSGTTGSPTYIGLTRHDIDVWNEFQARVYYANGFRPGDRCLHAFGMSKGFVGGVPLLQTLEYMGVCDIPIGAESGTERLLTVLADQRPNVITGTPYFIIYLAEQVERVLGVDPKELSIRQISCGGEPGGGIPPIRKKMEELWNADAREMMGGTDMGSTYWGECEDKSGMHLCAQEFIIVEIIHPDTGEVLDIKEGVKGELVYTAIDREASPLLRFRSRDHVEVTGTECSCGRTSFKIRCFGRTDDMLIVKGINVFPSAIKDVVSSFEPRTTGSMKVIVDFPGHATQEPLKISVEHGYSLKQKELPQLKEELEKKLRDTLNFRPRVAIVPPDTHGKPGAKKVPLIERVAPS
jgi:phenylacetate-CoA ligase